jgi:hypothetical protein
LFVKQTTIKPKTTISLSIWADWKTALGNANSFTNLTKLFITVPDFEPPDFEPIDVDYSLPKPTEMPEKPIEFERLCDAARQLSVPFDYVRVDLYDTRRGPFFGEFTFTPDQAIRCFTDGTAFGVNVLRKIKAATAVR